VIEIVERCLAALACELDAVGELLCGRQRA
jgi:hypothetical protein